MAKESSSYFFMIPNAGSASKIKADKRKIVLTLMYRKIVSIFYAERNHPNLA